MKPLQNPTTYFFKQAENPPNPYKEEISSFVNRLINKHTCLLCKEPYNLNDRVPRILIHCGHTFCTQCLLNFFLNRRVRCPMCLKLVKHLDNLDRLPINHTVFAQLVEEDIKECKKKGTEPKIKDAAKFLFIEFERVQKEAHMQENPQKIDPDSGLPFCTFHPDRVEHFYCSSHKTAGCRVCIEIGHNKPDCSVVDLYEINDSETYALMQATILGIGKEQNLASAAADPAFQSQNIFLGVDNFNDPFKTNKEDDEDFSDELNNSI